MKKKMILGVLVIILLVIGVQSIFALDSEIVITNRGNSYNDTAYYLYISIGNKTVESFGKNKPNSVTIPVSNGTNVVSFRSCSTWAGSKDVYDYITVTSDFNRIYVDFYYEKRQSISNIRITRTISLFDEKFSEALSRGDYSLAKNLISKNSNFNINQRDQNGNTLLIKEARKSSINFNAVKFFVQNGANINLRNNAGETAASIAYDKGEIEVYNFLKEQGAIDFEPRQVAQAEQRSNSTYNDSYDYSPPSSSSSGSSTPSRNTGKEIADSISRAFEAPIENGRYRISGRSEEISFAGIAKSGSVFFKDASGTTHRGTYSIDGDRLTINVMNKSFFYSITSKTSFSGHGEAWFRVGY